VPVQHQSDQIKSGFKHT